MLSPTERNIPEVAPFKLKTNKFKHFTHSRDSSTHYMTFRIVTGMKNFSIEILNNNEIFQICDYCEAIWLTLKTEKVGKNTLQKQPNIRWTKWVFLKTTYIYCEKVWIWVIFSKPSNKFNFWTESNFFSFCMFRYSLEVHIHIVSWNGLKLSNILQSWAIN